MERPDDDGQGAGIYEKAVRSINKGCKIGTRMCQSFDEPTI